MTDEEIHNIYLHMSGKAEGLVEATGTADFPVLFARAILEYEGLRKDMQNMASESTYKEALETKDEPVYWEMPDGKIVDKWGLQFYRCDLKDLKPLYTTPQRTWVGLTEEDLKPICDEWRIVYGAWMDDFARDIESKLKEKNHG